MVKIILFFVLFVITLPVVRGATYTVCASGCDYTSPQSAVDAASYGDVIELTAGETFTGALQLKAKEGTPAYIVIRSSRVGEISGRVTPSDTAKLAKIEHTGYVISVEEGANYYRLEGLEITATVASAYYLVTLYERNTYNNNTAHERAQLNHHIIIDRCYLHGTQGVDGPFYAIRLDCGYAEITNCWLGEIKNANSESKAIMNVTGSGPFVIRNNHLESAAITTLFGGARPNIQGIRAENAWFLGNHYYRPWYWLARNVTTLPAGTCMWDSRGGEFARYTTPEPDTYWECQSGTWTEIASGAYPTLIPWQKNLFEIKNARHVWVRGNLLEHGWYPGAQSQRGAGFLFNQVDGNDASEWQATIRHVKVEDNWVRQVPWGLSVGVLGTWTTYHTIQRDVFINNNIFAHIGEEPYSNQSATFTQSSVTGRFAYTNNTVVMDRGSGVTQGAVAQMSVTGSDYSTEMLFVGNVASFGYNGFFDTEKGGGSLWNALDLQWSWPARAMSKNVIVDSQARRASGFWDYPELNLLMVSDSPQSQTIPCASCAVGRYEGGPQYWENAGTNDVGFEDYSGGDYRLAATSPYKGWSHEGQDPGADVVVVEWATADAESGTHNPYLDFRVRALVPATTTAALRYTAYSTGACAVTVADNPSYTSPEFSDAGSTGNRDRLVSITGLSAETRWWYKILCDSTYRRSGVFWTR